MLIVEYTYGNEEWTGTEVVPVAAPSKEAFKEAFDSAMAAYDPDGREKFSIFGQIFSYDRFVYWFEKQKTPRRSEWLYDVDEPAVYTPDEWLAKHLLDSERLLNDPDAARKVAVINDAEVSTQAPGR